MWDEYGRPSYSFVILLSIGVIFTGICLAILFDKDFKAGLKRHNQIRKYCEEKRIQCIKEQKCLKTD